MTENKYLADGPLVVAIDSSTTSTKAIVVDAEGNIWHTAKQNIQLHTPAMDQYEHNPIRWWETSRATIGEVLSKLSPTDRSRIAAIGITHQRESFAPFNKDGRPLRNGILWLDGRATEQIRRRLRALVAHQPHRYAQAFESSSNPICQKPISSSFICG